MNHALLTDIATAHLGLAALHHLVTVVLGVIWWQRREELGRILPAYLAASFLTVAWSMRGPLWLTGGAPALVLAAIWIRETVRPECVMVFTRTPKPRLALAAAAALVALAFPGYSSELPAFIVSPLGVLIAPTLLLGLSLLVAVDARAARIITAAHALAGLVCGVACIVADGPTAPGLVGGLALIVMSVVAALIVLGLAPTLEEEELPRETSVEQIRSRLYQKKTLLPGPRDPRRRGGRFGRR